jgi:integrase
MPRPSRLPAYPPRPHSSGQARIVYRGKTYYLGVHGSDTSRREYARVVGELATGVPAVPHWPGKPVSVARLVELWLQDARQKRGPACKEIREVGRALMVLVRLHGKLQAATFGVPHLAMVRDSMATGQWMTDEEREKRRARRQPVGWCRNQVNHAVVRVRTVWRWAEQAGLVPEGRWNHLRSLAPLDGRNLQVRSTAAREPATRQQLDAVLPVVAPVVAAMAELQWESGMRPGEVCRMTAGAIDRAGPHGCWLYRLERDKGSWRTPGEAPAPVVLNERCQEIIEPWLRAARSPGDYLFPPSRRRQNAHYTEFSYAQAIRRGCDQAGVKRFSPYQLRHAAKARIEAEFGENVARQILRQRSIESTRQYARKIDTDAAARAMKSPQPTSQRTGQAG